LLSPSTLLAFRGAQRGREKKDPEDERTPPPVGAIHESPLREGFVPYGCKQDDFRSEPLK